MFSTADHTYEFKELEYERQKILTKCVTVLNYHIRPFTVSNGFEQDLLEIS
jgi:hypothetical protein